MRHLITLLAVTTLMLIPKTASAEHGWATIVYEYENHTWHHDYVEAWMGVYDSTMSEIEAARQNLEQNYPHLEVEYVGIDEEESDCTYDFDTQFYHAYSKGTFSFRTRIRPPVTPGPDPNGPAPGDEVEPLPSDEELPVPYDYFYPHYADNSGDQGESSYDGYVTELD